MKDETNNNRNVFGVIAILLAIVSIIIVYTRLATFMADYCPEKRMDYPGQYKWDAHMYYDNSELTVYRHVVNLLSYVVLPGVLIYWAYRTCKDAPSIWIALGMYVLILVLYFLFARFITLKRLIIFFGLWLLVMAATSNLRMKKFEEEYPDGIPYSRYGRSVEPEPSFEEKVFKLITYTEMLKKATGHDNMYDRMEEEDPGSSSFLMSGLDDDFWSDSDDDDED